MSNKQNEREQNLIGWDAAPVIRQARKEMCDAIREGRLHAERDKPEYESRMTVNVMVFQESGGWRVESLGTVFEGQDSQIVVHERSERMLLPEFRWALLTHLVTSRFCKEDQARDICRKADIVVQGRVVL